MYSTLEDLSHWAAFQLSAYPPRNDADSAPARRASMREAHSFSVLRAVFFSKETSGKHRAIAKGTGLGWAIDHDCERGPTVWHNGGTEGYSSIIAFSPDRGIAVIGLTNESDAEIDSVAVDAMAILASAASPRSPTPSARLRAFVQEIEGMLNGKGAAETFYDQKFTGDFKHALPKESFQNGLVELRTSVGACGAFEPVASEHDTAEVTLRCEKGNAELQFKLNEGGQLHGLILRKRKAAVSPRN